MDKQNIVDGQRKRIMSKEGVLAVVFDDMIEEVQQIEQEKIKQQELSEDSPDILPEVNQIKINQKIRITKHTLNKFIKKHFIILNDEEMKQYKQNILNSKLLNKQKHKQNQQTKIINSKLSNDLFIKIENIIK